MNAENQNDEFDNHDWQDKLLDRALAEVVGGETPPELSEQILAAADKQLATLPSRGSEMSTSPRQRQPRKFAWLTISVAVAAGFLAVALWLPMNNGPQNGDVNLNNLKDLAMAEPSVSDGLDRSSESGPRSEVLVREQGKKAASNKSEETLMMMETPRIIMEAESPPASSNPSADGSTFITGNSEKKAVAENSAATPSPYYLSDDVQFEALSEGSGQQQGDSKVPVLGKIPYIDRKFRNLGVAAQGTQALAGEESAPALPTPQSAAPDNHWAYGGRRGEMGLQGLINDAHSPESGPIPDQAEWEELTAHRKKYASIDLTELDSRAEKTINESLRVRNANSQLGDLDLDDRLNLNAHGQGPGKSGDQYTRIQENPFIVAQGEQAVSTFSIDVDTASYANVRQFLTQSHRLPPPDAVRIEELVNYFDYDYAGPKDERPFAAHLEVAACPWNDEHRLVRIGLKGREMDRKARPLSNLVFLVDVSGSMNEPNKLPLLVEGMKLLTRELGENDKISIVVYASSEGLALPSTRGDQQQTILTALDQLRAGGSTAGGAGIELAYKTAQENFVEGGVNRVILCTDGDFNVGVTSTAELERLAEQKAKDSGVFLTVLGFGRGNLNDAMMEAISGKGNGNYNYVDNLTEARKVLVEEMTGTLVTIAKDVKIQVEFNPAKVAGYRLLGYENRMLRTEDFNDDKKDAGEIGAGHAVTALYEIVPAGKAVDAGSVDPLKYQPEPEPTVTNENESDELLTLKLRYKQPDGDTSTKIEFPLANQGGSFADASEDLRFAAAVASYGMLLRDSQYKGNATFDSVLEIAQGASSRDPHGYRAEFLELVRLAGQLAE